MEEQERGGLTAPFIFLMNMLIDGAMIHEEEILKLYDYMDRNYQLPDPVEKEKFEKISYGRWAIEEIIQILSDYPAHDAELLIVEYAIMMRQRSEANDIDSYIFRIAAETADDVLERIIK